MASPIWKILQEPYPFYYEKRNLIWLVPGIFLFGTLFLYIFKPFNITWEEHRYPFLVICVIHSLVAILSLLPFLVLANLFVQDKNAWTYAKEFLLMLSGITMVGVGNFLIRDVIYINSYNDWASVYLFEEVKNAFLVGAVVYPFFLWLNGTRLTSKYQKEGVRLSSGLGKRAVQNEEEIAFYNSMGGLELSLQENQLLFVKSEGNYIDVYYWEDTLKKKLIRNTLSSVSEAYPTLFRPHRSYLVNINKVNRIGGNSQGYTLHFEGCDPCIPVSRNKKGELLKLRQQLA